MALYGNRIGIEAVYQASGVYKGNIEVNGDKSYVPEGLVNMDMLLVNTYYAFNARRFSYPAAFHTRGHNGAVAEAFLRDFHIPLAS